MRNVQVNWRPGTTSFYESIWNLRRKFSFLNRTGVTLTCEVFKPATSTASGNIALDNPALKLLKEPLRLFRSSSLSNFLISDRISGNSRRFAVGKELRYCSSCISRGYHSAVHQSHWVALCPIHLVPLIAVSYTHLDVYKRQMMDSPLSSTSLHWHLLMAGSWRTSPIEYGPNTRHAGMNCRSKLRWKSVCSTSRVPSHRFLNLHQITTSQVF